MRVAATGVLAVLAVAGVFLRRPRPVVIGPLGGQGQAPFRASGAVCGVREISQAGSAVDPLLAAAEVPATTMDRLLPGDPFGGRGTAPTWKLALALLASFASSASMVWARPLWAAVATLALVAGTGAGWVFLLSRSGSPLSPLGVTAVLAANFLVLILLTFLLDKRKASARQRTVQALETSELRYRRLVENSNDAIVVLDSQGKLVFANGRFHEWFGVAGPDVRGVMLEDYVAPEWRAVLREARERRLHGDALPDRFEYEGIRTDGTRRWIEALVTKVEEDGRIVGSQAALRDITERKRMEAQYLHAQKMESVGRLAGGVAHDFNNLLTVINGYSELLLAQEGAESSFRTYLEPILAAGKRAADLTQKLLAFSRKQMAQPEPVDLNLVVAEARETFDRLAGENIELINNLSPVVAKVMADPGQMHQVLMNLVANARDNMPHGGRLTIETKNVEVGEDLVRQHPELALGSYVYLGVADTGLGMSEEVKRHLFEPFFTTKGAGKGSGLGLATVYGIVRQSGGWIWAWSAPGRGTAFHIYLPRIAGDLARPASAAARVDALEGSETVLLVEDQEAVRQIEKTILESYGYRVLQAFNGLEAIALAEEYRDTIHLLLTDVILPQMDGRVLADQLKRTRPYIKVLYTSGYSEEVIGHHGLLDGGAAYLPKPFTPEALAAKVREVLARDGGPPSR